MSDRSGRYDIWSIRPDGSGLEQITRNAGRGPYWPVFSPDGKVFAFPDGTNSFVFHPGPAPPEGRVEPLPAYEQDSWFEVNGWSPDGSKLAGDAVTAGAGLGNGIVLYDLKSRRFDRLTESGNAPSFLPDGRRIVYVDDSALRLVDSASKRKREILPARADSALDGFAFSRDCRSLYILRDLRESDIWEATFEK